MHKLHKDFFSNTMELGNINIFIFIFYFYTCAIHIHIVFCGALFDAFINLSCVCYCKELQLNLVVQIVQ